MSRVGVTVKVKVKVKIKAGSRQSQDMVKAGSRVPVSQSDRWEGAI